MPPGRPRNKLSREILSDRFLDGRLILPAMGDSEPSVRYLKTATEGQLLAACEDVADLKKLIELIGRHGVPAEVKDFVNEIIERRAQPPER